MYRWAECQFACKTEEPIRIRVRKEPISKGLSLENVGTVTKYCNKMSQKQRNYNRKQTQKSKKQRRQSSEIHYADDEAIAIEKIRDNYRYLRCKYKNIFFILIYK